MSDRYLPFSDSELDEALNNNEEGMGVGTVSLTEKSFKLWLEHVDHEFNGDAGFSDEQIALAKDAWFAQQSYINAMRERIDSLETNLNNRWEDLNYQDSKIDDLKSQLSQAKELMQLVAANNVGGFGHDDGVVAIDGYVIHKHAIDAMSTWLAQQEGE